MNNGFLDDLPDLEMPQTCRKKRDKSGPAGMDETKDRKEVVRYVKLRCPHCRGTRVPVYSTRDLPIRHHKCSDCGHTFDSIES